MNAQNSNIKILISSHSKSSDIWYITDYFIKKHWKSKKEILLGANGVDKKEFVPGDWKYINQGDDISFSKSLKDYVNFVDSKYFILMLDDFIILEDVDINTVLKAFDFIEARKGVYLRLIPSPKGDIRVDDDFSQIDVRAKVPYITSLHMSIWDRDFLLELLKYDFNPWEFEIKAGKTKEALKNYDKFFVTNYPFIKYTHFVEKGKFYPFIKDMLDKEGVKLNSDRKFWSKEELDRLNNDNIFKNFIRNVIPNRYINKIRSILGRQEL